MNNLKGELSLIQLCCPWKKIWYRLEDGKKIPQWLQREAKNEKQKSKLDKYKDVIIDKLSIKRITVQGVYEFMVKTYGINSIGSYSNFNKYVRSNNLVPESKTEGHPRFEKNTGEQAHVDWKEDINIYNKYGELFTINVLHTTLKYSRYSHLDMSIQKRFDDVSRGLINSFIKFGGVPKELLFDNMSTVANVNVKPKKPTNAILNMAKEIQMSCLLNLMIQYQYIMTIHTSGYMIQGKNS